MKKNIFIFALLISFFGSGFEHTFLNTLIPVVTLELGGVEYFTWTSISFTIGNLILLPLMGRLADTYNKAYLFLLGNLIMATGAIFSALSENMIHLILARGLQGIGSGMITILTSIMIALVFELKDRVRWNAIFGVVYSVATFIGPVTAAFLSEAFTWRLIFISPIIFFSIANTLMILAKYHIKDNSPANKNETNILNNFLLIVIITLISLLVSFGGVIIPFDSPKLYLLLALAIFLIYLFYRRERKAKMGVFPYKYFKESLFVKCLLLSFGGAIGKLVILTFGPMFIMLTLQTTVANSGYVLIPMLVMAPISAYIFGKLLLIMPYKYIIFLNSISIAIGLFLFSLVNPESNYLFVICASIISGIGAGSISQLLLLILQEKYPKKDLSVITSTFTFFRWQGNIVGVALGSFLLILFSKIVFGNDSDGKLNELYKSAFSNSNNLDVIQSWSSVFQGLFLSLSIVLSLISLIALTLSKEKITKK